jgi:hypothetical protein
LPIPPKSSLFCYFSFDEDGTGRERWGVGILRGGIPSSPLYCVVEVFNCFFNLLNVLLQTANKLAFLKKKKSKVVARLTCRTHAGGWPASPGNARPHSWNLVAAPQCPAAVVSRDPHRAATPPSGTATSYTRNVHRCSGQNVTVCSHVAISRFLATGICCTALVHSLLSVHRVGNVEVAIKCLYVRSEVVVFNFPISLWLRRYATNRKVVYSIPDEIIAFFQFT